MTTQTPSKEQIRRDRVLLALRSKPDAIAAELDVAQGYMWNFERDGFVRISGRRSNGRGRPTNTYKLTPKGSKRASVLGKRA
jgi:predicted ArsR family transcriptional regulator